MEGQGESSIAPLFQSKAINTELTKSFSKATTLLEGDSKYVCHNFDLMMHSRKITLFNINIIIKFS